ncbi:MAG: glutaredoxin family protein [Acidobacteriota bacterium]
MDHNVIRIYTTPWCPDCWRAKQFLNRHGLQFEEINIEEIPGAAEFVEKANEGKRRVPTFEMEGRVFHCSPYDPVRLKSELSRPAEERIRNYVRRCRRQVTPAPERIQKSC